MPKPSSQLCRRLCSVAGSKSINQLNSGRCRATLQSAPCLDSHSSRHNSTRHNKSSTREHSTSSTLRTASDSRNNHTKQPKSPSTTTTTSSTSNTNTNNASPSPSASQPAAPTGSLAIIFTDIVKSTAIWESNAQAMTTAMSTHDHTLRSLLHLHSGYEVKQNGDGFMLAFASAVSALRFCLDAQQALLDLEWPDALLELTPARVTREPPPSTPASHSSSDASAAVDGEGKGEGEREGEGKGKVLFRGLRLRMSAHWGESVCTWNDVIQRMDYLGPTVNRAARFIQAAEGGQIVVSEEFLSALEREHPAATTSTTTDSTSTAHSDGHRPELHVGKGDAQVVDINRFVDSSEDGEGRTQGDSRFEVRLLGSQMFKGLPEPQKLYFIVPRCLHGRVELWPKHTYRPGSKGNIFEDG